MEGEVVIQTYSPDNASVIAASKQDYAEFYNQEILYRSISEYPPVVSLMAVLITSKDADLLGNVANKVKGLTDTAFSEEKKLRIIGPADAGVSKINDVYRKVIYYKHGGYKLLVAIKNLVESTVEQWEEMKKDSIQFDFNPMSGF